MPHTSPRTRVLTGALVTGALFSLSACGGSGGSDSASDDSAFTGQSAEKIAAASTKAMKGLESVHFAGDITSDDSSITLDIQLDTTGDCTGSFASDDSKAEIRSVDGSTWFKPNEAFWNMSAGESAATIIETVGDKWVALGEGDDSFSSFCDLDQLLGQLGGDTGATFTKGKTSEIDGEKVLEIKRSDPEDGDSSGYVRTGGDHYLAKLEKTGDNAGAVTFDQFDEKLDITPIADDDAISEADLN